jgi:anti-sigma factor RsiW
MECTDTKTQLYPFLDGDLSGQEQQMFEEHIKHCDSCQDELNETRELRRVLATLPVEPYRANFEKRVFAEVNKHYPDEQGHGFITGFASAVAAGLMLWIASLMFVQYDTSDKSMVALEINQQHIVRLSFDAVGDLSQVTLSIDLLEYIELAGYPGRKQLSRETDLQK